MSETSSKLDAGWTEELRPSFHTMPSRLIFHCISHNTSYNMIHDCTIRSVVNSAVRYAKSVSSLDEMKIPRLVTMVKILSEEGKLDSSNKLRET